MARSEARDLALLLVDAEETLQGLIDAAKPMFEASTGRSDAARTRARATHAPTPLPRRAEPASSRDVLERATTELEWYDALAALVPAHGEVAMRQVAKEFLSRSQVNECFARLKQRSQRLGSCRARRRSICCCRRTNLSKPPSAQTTPNRRVPKLLQT